jgi:recombination protein RecT
MTAPSGKLASAMGAPQAPKRERTPYEQFRAQINLVRRDIAALVGDKNVDRFIRVCLNAVQYNPKLLDADRRSLFLACMDAAQDGLIPDGSEAVLNIYPTKDREASKAQRRDVWVEVVQYLPMAYGLVQKIYEAGATFVDAVAVYERDHFKYQRGDSPMIEHTPYGGSEEPGKIIAAYCVVKFPGLETKREVMFRRDIEKVRKKSKAPDGLMWKEGDDGFYDQGAIKSVIHRINKQLPQSERLNRALAKDNKAIGLSEIADLPAEETGPNLAALADGRLEQQLRDQVLNGGAPAPQGEKVVVGEQIDDAVTGEKKEKAETPPLPQKGDKGTPELKVKFLGQIENAQATDVLDIVIDDVRFYEWEKADLDEMINKYQSKLAALKAE